MSLKERDGLYFMDVVAGSAPKTSVMLDLGSNATSIPPKSAARTKPLVNTLGLFLTYASMHITDVLVLSQLEIGDLVETNAVIQASDTPGIGIDLLSRFRLTLDLPHKRLILERSGSALPPKNGAIGIRLTTSTRNPRIGYVEAGSTAEKAGMREGDLLTAIDDVSTSGMSPLIAASLLVGDIDKEAVLGIEREGRALKLHVRRESPFARPRTLGLMANKKADQPMIVTFVWRQSPAGRAGLRVGDEVVRVNDQPVTNMPNDELAVLLMRQPLTFQVVRKGSVQPVTLTIEDATSASVPADHK